MEASYCCKENNMLLFKNKCSIIKFTQSTIKPLQEMIVSLNPNLNHKISLLVHFSPKYDSNVKSVTVLVELTTNCCINQILVQMSYYTNHCLNYSIIIVVKQLMKE